MCCIVRVRRTEGWSISNREIDGVPETSMVLYCRVTEKLVSYKLLTRIQPRLHQPHPTPSPTPSPTPAQTPTMLPTYIQSHLHFTFALNKHPALICIQPQLNLNNEHITFPPPLKAYLPPPSPLYSSAPPERKARDER